MKRLITMLCLTSLLATATLTNANDFTLIGNEHLDVITTYENGNLWNSSTANILTNAKINNYLITYDSSTVNILDGYVNYLFTLGNSSTANISGGNIDRISAYYHSCINISGGNINTLSAYNDTIVNISAVNINLFTVYNLRLNSPTRINITNSIITHLDSCINLQNNEHLDYTTDFTISDLASYGLKTTAATVDNLYTNIFTNDNSSLSISGGNINGLQAYDNSVMNISGGNVEAIFASDNSNINISDGNVNCLRTHADSYTTISGGTIGSLDIRNTSTVIFKGYDFLLDSGLSWDIDGQTILGTGILKGTWLDNTTFEIPIGYHDAAATIMAIPEPATILILTLGTLTLKRKKQKHQHHKKTPL